MSCKRKHLKAFHKITKLPKAFPKDYKLQFSLWACAILLSLKNLLMLVYTILEKSFYYPYQ